MCHCTVSLVLNEETNHLLPSECLGYVLQRAQPMGILENNRKDLWFDVENAQHFHS